MCYTKCVDSTEIKKYSAFCISVTIAVNTLERMNFIHSSQIVADTCDEIPFPALLSFLVCSHVHRSNWLHNYIKSGLLHTMEERAGRGVLYSSYSFTISTRPGERTPGTHWTEGWEGLWSDLNTEKILSPLPGIEPRSASRPLLSQTLYCVSYPAPLS
jgi:hypothetical protein